ncbi:lysosomal thioesterase PPT2-A-like [Saccostrea echinata]|uniref:lysosomal thioesterase PPT2-A-like n=1 Tax=Saccostrea echinata TaxID=191078 RepID=UPI002A7F31F1|nr:lysosomal thioesterase PPT2-A-like [Saccostrea echinata]
MIFLFLLLLTDYPVAAYKAVVFIHGLNGTSLDGNLINDIIQKLHPGTPYYAVNAFERLQTLLPLWEEVNIVKPYLLKYMRAHQEGIHLICYSQGGLVCRGLLSTIPDHNVDTFIALSSPLAGIFGDWKFTHKCFPNFVRDNAYRFLYSKIGQEIFLGNYWKDPHHLDLYRKFSKFLAPLNNDSMSPNVAEYKQNFLRIKKLILIGGPNDDVISPWQSSQFGFYNEMEEVQGMKEQMFYKEDSFGLKTMDEQNRIKTYTIPNIHHRHWVRNLTVIKDVIVKSLT